jgi:hypothetical protein
MDRNSLITLDNILEDRTDDSSKILKYKRGFYFYFNEPNKDVKNLKIHKHLCGNCAWGSGKINNADSGRNGPWIGPFESVDYIRSFVQTNIPDFQDRIDTSCSCTTL